MTEQEKAEIVREVIEEINAYAVTPPEMPTATTPDDVAYLPGVDAAADYIKLPVSQLTGRHVTMTQAEYDALVDAGTVDEDVYYYIEEETT